MNATLLLMLSLAQAPVAAEKPKSPMDEDATLRAAVAVSAKEFATRCEFKWAENRPEKFVLHPDPILRWSNPTAGTVVGEVFVWTDNGRPVVIGSWYRWFSPDWGRTFEVCSLSEGRMEGRIQDVRFWNPEAPGLKFQPLMNTDEPAASPNVRLAQMRRMAKDFTANLVDTRGSVVGIKRQLRLLPQPVFRYPTPGKNAEYIDGALFAFVEGTDPEMFLLVETASINAEPNWRFALVRMNTDEIQVTYRDQAIWTAPKIEYPLNLPRVPYSLFTSEDVLSEPTDGAKPSLSKTRTKP